MTGSVNARSFSSLRDSEIGCFCSRNAVQFFLSTDFLKEFRANFIDRHPRTCEVFPSKNDYS